MAAKKKAKKSTKKTRKAKKQTPAIVPVPPAQFEPGEQYNPFEDEDEDFGGES